MACSKAILALFVLLVSSTGSQGQQPGGAAATSLVPAVFIFGDSSVDVGNNNYLTTAMFKANFAPYGQNYDAHSATGRFCDGKLVVDFTAQTLGFSSSPPPYLSPQTSGKALLGGVNFASAGSGYYEGTALRYNAISMPQQIRYMGEYRVRLATMVGKARAAATISQAAYIIGLGNGDFMQNYYINPSLRQQYPTVQQFSTLLLTRFAGYVRDLHAMGARRVAVTSLPAIGCLPAAINHYGNRIAGCVGWLNRDAEAFTARLKSTAAALGKELPGLKIAVLDIIQPLIELSTNPTKHGFVDSVHGCCGTGTSETTVVCKPNTPLTCRNPSQYVYWDGVHPTEAANKFIAEAVVLEGIVLLS